MVICALCQLIHTHLDSMPAKETGSILIIEMELAS